MIVKGLLYPKHCATTEKKVKTYVITFKTFFVHLFNP